LDAGPQRRRELRDRRGRSRPRRDVRGGEGAADRRSTDDAGPGWTRRTRGSGRDAGTKSADDRAGQGTDRAGRTTTAGLTVRVHESEQSEHERRRAALVGDDGIRPQYRRDQMADTDRYRTRAVRARDSNEHRIALSAERSAGDGWRTRLLRDGIRPSV